MSRFIDHGSPSANSQSDVGEYDLEDNFIDDGPLFVASDEELEYTRPNLDARHRRDAGGSGDVQSRNERRRSSHGRGFPRGSARSDNETPALDVRQSSGLRRVGRGVPSHSRTREGRTPLRSRQGSDQGLRPVEHTVRQRSRNDDGGSPAVSLSSTSTFLIRRPTVERRTRSPSVHSAGVESWVAGQSRQRSGLDGRSRERSTTPQNLRKRRCSRTPTTPVRRVRERQSPSVISWPESRFSLPVRPGTVERQDSRSVYTGDASEVVPSLRDESVSVSGDLRLSRRGSVQRVSSPDPFEIPRHLRTDELKGMGVPGKRLGTGKPRWVARYFLFTVSQSGYGWPYEEFIALIEAVGGKCRIGRERHGDGGYHFHAFVDFERKFEFENPHRFCVGPPQTDSRRTCPTTTHCNIQPVPRTPFHCWDYVGKDDDVVYATLERPYAKGPQVTRDDMYTGSVAMGNKEGFHSDLRKHSMRDYVLFRSQIERFADAEWGTEKRPAELPRIEEDGVYIHWERYPEARQWVLETFSDPISRIKSMSRGLSYPADVELRDIQFLADHPGFPNRRRPKSLIVFGASRLGKTLFGTNLGPHVAFHRNFNLKKLLAVGTENVEFVIWDDVPWSNPALKKEGYKAWLGAQRAFELDDKYDRKVSIEWGKPCVFLTNRNPYWRLGSDDRDFLERNCILISLGGWDEDRSNAIASSDADETP